MNEIFHVTRGIFNKRIVVFKVDHTNSMYERPEWWAPMLFWTMDIHTFIVHKFQHAWCDSNQHYHNKRKHLQHYSSFWNPSQYHHMRPLS